MKRIGILGGSFNPIHLGHLFIGVSAAEAFSLDRVLLMPCTVSPFKVGEAGLLSGEERLRLVEAAIRGDSLFQPCDIELRRGGVSYAVDSVRTLCGQDPDARYFFIIGMDSLLGLSRWHEVNELLSLCEIITVARPGTPLPEVGELGFPVETAQKLLKNVIQGRLCDISSSEIRRRIAEGRSIRYLVPDAVEKEIRAKGYYAAAPLKG